MSNFLLDLETEKQVYIMTEEKRPRGGGGGAGRKAKKAADPRTLFVRFAPPSASVTRQHLSDHFSDYGPVGRCSVIRQQNKQSRRNGEDGGGEEGDGEANQDRGTRGFGFVRFVNESDAAAAAEAIRKKSKGNKKGGGEVMVVDGARYKIFAERAVDADAAPGRKMGADGRKKDAAPAAPPAEITPAKTAEKTSAHPPAETDDYKAEAKRKRTSRVIVRNLSFHAGESHVRSAMEKEFGPVSAVDLPGVPSLPGEQDGKNNRRHGRDKNGVPRHRGFAFVTFTNANAARMAVERGTEVQIKGRRVAVDFSVSKAEHRKIAKEDEEDEKDDDSSDSSGSDSDGEDDDNSKSGDESSSDDGGSGSDSDSDDEGDDDEKDDASQAEKETPTFDPSESSRTLFLRNIPFDATRHDVFELFRKFGRIEAVHLVKDRATGVFKGTAFVRFQDGKGCEAAMEASGGGEGGGDEHGTGTFVSGKNAAIGLGSGGSAGGGLVLKGRSILVDPAVDRTTASSLAVQRDEDGKPIKKAVGKDKRNMYLKNEGRVAASSDSALARDDSAKFGGGWEELPPGDKARREKAFADKSTKLRSPLFFINPNRLSIRNLAKHVTEAELKQLVFGALKRGLEEGLATPKDAVSHWRAGGELPHAEVMRRATDPDLVCPPLDEKNVREVMPSTFIERDVSGGKKVGGASDAQAPSKGFGWVEFQHHAHALAALRQLNNNPEYSAGYAAGGRAAAELAKRRKGKGGKKRKGKGQGGKGGADGPEGEGEFVGEDGRVLVPRLIVEFAVSSLLK